MVLILPLFVCLTLIYLYTTRNFRYWSKRKVKHDPPVPIFGNHYRNLFGFESLAETYTELYFKYPDEKVVGFYRGMMPGLLVRDLDIARSILNVEFSHFYLRGMGRDPEKEPLLSNLFHIDGDKWKFLRQRLTPVFTTAKLRAMFPLIIKCAEKLQVAGEHITSKGGDFDCRDFMARFSTDFIGACGFGIEMNSINDEHSAFRELGRKSLSFPLRHIILLGIWELFPEVRNSIRVSSTEVEKAVSDLVESIFRQRNYKPCGRNDFVDFLLELAQKGKMESESIENSDSEGNPIRVEFELKTMDLIAQVFVFFVAGFETSSSATSFTLHQLAFNPDIQTEIQNEIDQVLAKYDNKLCYDAISELSHLEMAFKEAMRLFPSSGFLQRLCAKRYTIPKLGVTIEPGVITVIPIQAIQTDEKYFDNPMEFKPQRFSDDAGKKINNYTYMPFGAGPRACIGGRLGQMQSLAGLAAVLQKFTVEPTPKTPVKLPIDPWRNVLQCVKGGIPLRLKLRSKLN
ncbi:unnamed protein product [Leptosia nina]|uniref:unspecific monooxygenase n=1 Tax=Leptosia nina TaxID=320188 RepID=A0AAV1JV44_9NEOP